MSCARIFTLTMSAHRWPKGAEFSNARYLFARQEWEHWERAELRARHTTDPYYEDRLLPIMRAAGRGWWPTIQRMDRALTRTHPRHVCANARSTQRSVILSCDLMHTALQRAKPQPKSCFCVDPKLQGRDDSGFLRPSPIA